jgi:Carboxypeptidase regulatory-like domain
MRKATMALAALATLLACENGGANRTLGITATGVVSGEVYFDANGSRSRDAADAAFAGARLRLLAPGGADTVARATTGADGTFRLAGVPVGTYAIVVDSASAGDSARVVEPAPVLVTVLPRDSVQFIAAISYPVRTIAEARSLAPGERLFVRATAIHGRATFSDTSLHVVDATGAMRATRVRPSAVAAGDSVVLRARIAERLGQRVLDDVTVFIVGPTFLPAAPTLSSVSAAAGGVAGSLDASLVRVLDALVTDTATVGGNFEMRVTDGSGELTVILDRAADIGFRAPLPLGLYVPGARFDLSGVLVPTGTGVWRLKPRSVLDLTRR